MGAGMTRTLCLLLLFIVPTALAQDERTRRAFVDLADRKYKMQQADQTFPGRRMSASENPLPLPPAGLPNDFDIQYEWEGEIYGIDDFNERTHSNALLILKNGAVVTEIYLNGSDPTTKFISWSIYGKQNRI